MWKDHIVEEVRRVRKEQAARFDFDICAILEDARQKQKTSKHKIVSFLSSKKKKSSNAMRSNGSMPHHLVTAGHNQGFTAKEERTAYTVRQKRKKQEGKK